MSVKEAADNLPPRARASTIKLWQLKDRAATGANRAPTGCLNAACAAAAIASSANHVGVKEAAALVAEDDVRAGSGASAFSDDPLRPDPTPRD
jgi:hypothetical protein